MEHHLVDDLGFVIDGLYASGWWPGPQECCAQSSDGRWIPTQATMLSAFEHYGSPITIRRLNDSDAAEATWKPPNGGSETVRGRCEQEALILAYTHLHIQCEQRTENWSLG